jgi:ketosteroid isomerase-like protein
MSEENVAVVCRGYERYNRTGEPDPSLFDPEVEFIPDPRTGDAPLRGREKLIEYLKDRASTFRAMHFEVERTWDWDDQVLVFVRVHGSGAASGAGFEIRIAHAWALRNGKATGWQAFGDRDEALQAFGLSDDAASR